MKVSWSTFKGFVDDRSLSIQWIDENEHYYLSAVDGAYVLEHTIKQVSPASTEQTDFENNYKSSGNAKIDLNTYVNTDLNVTASISNVNIENGALETKCPTMPGSKWRTALDDSDITLSTSSYTTLKTLSNGTLHSIVLDFSSDRVDVKFTLDSVDIFTINLDNLEDVQTSGSSSATPSGGLMCVKTGSRFLFTPPCGLKYSSLTISAKGESNNRKLSGYLIHYSVD